MTQVMTRKNKSAAYRIVIIQFAVLVTAAVITLFWGSHFSWSLLVGGLVAIIPHLLFTIKAFQYSGAQAAKQVMRSFYIGEAIKFFSMIVLFVVMFLFLPVLAKASLLGFVLAMSVQFFAPLIVKTS